MYSDYSDSGAAALGLFLGLLLVLPFLLIGYVIGSFFFMKLFEKAGVEGKWRAWVPVYNTLIFAKLGDLSPWWLLILWGGAFVLSWVPVIGWLIGVAAGVYLVLAAYRVQTKLQKEAPWIILYIFLAIVWLGIMAFDKSRWNLAVPPAPWANTFLADKTQWQGIPAQAAVGGYNQGGYGAPGTQAPGAYPPPPAGYTPPAPGGTTPPPPAPGGTTPPPPAPGGPTEPPAAPEPPRS